MRKIKWNRVTWYSKAGAAILFLIVLPVLSFNFGTFYQEAYELANPRVSIVHYFIPMKANPKEALELALEDYVYQGVYTRKVNGMNIDLCDIDQKKITIHRMDFFEFNADPYSKEVVIQAKSCAVPFRAPAYPDINKVFRILPGGSLKQIPIERKNYSTTYKTKELAVRDGKLYELLVLSEKFDSSKGTITQQIREVTYNFQNDKFVESTVKNSTAVYEAGEAY